MAFGGGLAKGRAPQARHRLYVSLPASAAKAAQILQQLWHG